MGKSTCVLVTGGAGFLGTAVVRALASKHPDWKIVITDIKPKEEWLSPCTGVEYIHADLRNTSDTFKAVEWAAPRVIIHCSSTVLSGIARYGRRPQDVDRIHKTNVVATENLIAAAKEFGVQAMVYTSSYSVLADDLDHDYPNMDENTPVPEKSLPYGESKAKAEKLVLATNSAQFATCVLRSAGIFGPGDYQIVPAMHACIAKWQAPFLIGDGDNLYDLIYVDNNADAHVLAVENLLESKTAAGEVIFISNGQPVTFRDLLLATWGNFDYTPKFVVKIPGGVAWWMGLVAEFVSWVGGTPPALSRNIVKEIMGVRYSCQDKARRILGFKPKVDLWDGLRMTCEFYKKTLATQQKSYILDHFDQRAAVRRL